jgi:hypothetical protein
MPGFDGRGPLGLGPMTGRAGGYCVLKVPDTPGEPQSGFAGLAGNEVTICNDSRNEDLAGLQTRLREVQAALHRMTLRVADLEAGRGKS